MSDSKRNVYVFNGYGDRGGAFLNFQLGRICHKKFGSPLFMVRNLRKKRSLNETHPRFDYSFEFPEVHLDKMKEMVKPDDLFICNPTHSTKWFGLELPMKKLMYMQGINTYPVLDIFYDHYVSVSHFVQQHIEKIYNIKPQIISPFINHSIFQNKTPWKQRSNDLLILGYKGYARPVFQYLQQYYKEKYPTSYIQFKIVDGVSQKELSDLFNQHKYYLTLNPCEGFGLPPLEAMACGCAVVGFDSMGGRDYLYHEKNAYIVDYGDFEQLAEYLRIIELDPDIGESLVKEAIGTASHFSYSRFETEWTKYLEKHVYND
ncbi:glycosyltransferase [Siminovitchia acidinfaciens]|uniref:Glycosyltransferase n=1 Tax=Siminovitchia acidinfaciens TaxID=2321395 RepID=A0A429Y4F8_9BACI|nr:glycosyltransferase [Siminovitchia acidinfaciens]RST76312.1 glycosyltransferase [Siminovitchia acidinfaciens]